MKRRDYQKQREEFKKRIELERQKHIDEMAVAKRIEQYAARVRKLRREDHYGMEYYVFEKGKITSEKEIGVWHREGDNIFIRCTSCLTIIKIEWDDIDERGFTENCLICPSRRCHMHQYIKFKGFWDKEVPKK